MLKKSLLGLSLMALGASAILPVFAADDAVKFSAIAPVGDLVAEADEAIAELDEALSSNDEYLKAKKKTIPKAAGLLAVLAQGIVQHDEKSDLQKSAADLRDAALALGASDSYDAAKSALADVKAAKGGKGGSAKADYDWGKLIDMDSLMSEVNVRNGKLRRAMRKLPDDVEEASRDASVLALLGLAIAADTHEVKNKADVPKWEGYAHDLKKEFAAVAVALKAKDLDASKTAFLAGAKSCSGCHSDFRDN